MKTFKTYENEQNFVENFANDVNAGIKEYEVNGIQFTVNGKFQNSSKAAVYKVNVNGMDKEVTIIQLKKLLNVTYKKEYNRTNDRATSAGTKVSVKTDEELQATAETIREAVDNDIERLVSRCRKYGVSVSLNFGGQDVAQTWYDKARIMRDRKTAEEQAKAEKAEADKAAKIANIQMLTEMLQKAMADGNLSEMARLSAEMAKAAK